LLGVLAQGSSVGAKVLADAGVTLDRAELALNLTPRTLVVSTGAKGLSETAKLTLKMSWDIAQEFNQDFLGTEHILYSILSQKNARATVLLRDMNVDITTLTSDLEDFFDRQNSDYQDATAGTGTRSKKQGRMGPLETFGTDLTAKAIALAASNKAAFQAKLDADKVEGSNFGITATPSMIIGDKVIVGLTSYANVKAAIDAALAKK